MKNKELDNMLDNVTNGIRSEQIEDRMVSEAGARVWSSLSAANTPVISESAAATGDRIEGCADFQSLIPAYLGGKLSEARSLLLVDHTHECIPCRRALKQAREARIETAAPVRRRQPQRKTA